MSHSRTQGEADALRAEFFGWQCRLRQHVMRYAAGRPTPGLSPAVYLSDGATNVGEVIVLINKRESQSHAQQFRHMVLKTQDPNERYDSALDYFKAAYYQQGHDFGDRLTALFGSASTVADALKREKQSQLHFDQFNQRYVIDCGVEELPEHDIEYQVTYWHNRLFNPNMPAGVRVLAFSPNWMTAVSTRG